MAQITGAANERVFGIQKWLGLNQNPDGDTKLKMGEAAQMQNWRITRDRNLQKRPGTRTVQQLTDEDRIDQVWTGFVDGHEVVMAIGVREDELDGNSLWLYELAEDGTWDDDPEPILDSAMQEGDDDVSLGAATDNYSCCMFGFEGKLWILTGSEYYCWDGDDLAVVEGYRPLVAINIPPNGGGETLEGVNKLNGLRRCWISPDGTGTKFLLPKGGTIDDDVGTYGVIDLSTDTELTEGTDYSFDDDEGSVTFLGSAPAESVNSYEIYWQVEEDYRSTVCAMQFSETYNGTQDTRVFLYGDGGADAFYSDLDYDGKARADYFPDLNQIRIGIENTPITGMIRQLSRLVCFKPDGAWSVQFGNITDAEGNTIAAFYSTPINRTIGNEAMGQVQLVLNNPVTLFGQDVYEWKPNSYGNLTADERNAFRISDRVYEALNAMDLKSCRTFDDNYRQEYYVFNNDGQILVWGYAADAWYFYDGLRLARPFVYQNDLYNAYSNCIQRISTEYYYDQFNTENTLDDDNETVLKLNPIDCYWESGSMSFGMDYQRKYAAMIWLGIKPESKSYLEVTVQTDKNATYQEKVVERSLATFAHVNFNHWVFNVNRKPQMKRLKIKAKKFVFYKLIFKTKSNETTATVVSADIRVRFTGYTK